LDCSCSLKRAAIVGVPALIGFLGIVWLLPALCARRPWSSACAEGGFAPAGAETNRLAARAVVPAEQRGPDFNYALAANGAQAAGGTNPGELIDGNVTNYAGGTGFATSVWNTDPPQFFIVTLKEPAAIDCIRMLLWDRDPERYYRYKLEVCADAEGKAWELVADHRGAAEQCRGWQVVRFKQQQVKLIRLTGTFNSANSGFHVVELQASLGLPAGTPPPTQSDGLEF